MNIRIRAKLPYFDLVIKLRPFQLIFYVPLLNRGKIYTLRMTTNTSCVIFFFLRENAGHCLYHINFGNFISKNYFHFLTQKKEWCPFIYKGCDQYWKRWEQLIKFCEQKERDENRRWENFIRVFKIRDNASLPFSILWY